MSDQVQHEILKALEKADNALHNAEYDLNGGFLLATANRAYYTCYYCMTALLYTKDVVVKTHQGTHSKFAELFIKTGIFSTDTSNTITLLFDYRQQADYDFDAEISYDEAKELIKKASEFLQLTRIYFDRPDSL